MIEGWAAIPNWLVRDRDVSPLMLAVYAVVQSHAGSQGTTRLLVQTIADEAGMSYKSAQRSLQALNAKGVLWWEAQGAATQRTASIYHPLQEPNPRIIEAVHAPANQRAKAKSSPTRTVPQSSKLDSQTVPTQQEPQDSATPVEPVRSQGPYRTVPESNSYGPSVQTPEPAPEEASVRSQGPYVRSERPREEEPSKKNPSISSSPSVSPLVEAPWTGPTDEDWAWVEREMETRRKDPAPDLTSVTEKVLTFAKPSSSTWQILAISELNVQCPRLADLGSTFKDTAVAGDEKIRLGKNDWRPSREFIENFTKQNPEYEHLWDRGVREEIARKMLDFIDGLKDRGEPYPDPFDMTPRVQGRIRGLWKTNVEMHYASAISQIVKRQNHQMTGTE